MLLTRENYKIGFLVDDEAIGGVTEMNGGLFAAYVSHYLTGETFAYQEFSALEPALEYLAAVPRKWIYEAVGCGAKTGKKSGGCNIGGCGTGLCR